MAIYHIQNYKGLKLLRSPPEKFGELTNENFKLLAKGQNTNNTDINGLKARVEAIENSYVISVNDIAGEVDIVGAGGILVSTSGQTITISGGGGGTSIHNSLTGLQGGDVNEYYHLSQLQYDDYIGSTEVANISAYLQTQIDNITGAGGSDAVLIGGDGIQVVESPADTWTISVSGDYITTTEVSNISGNLQSQIDAITTVSATGSLLQGSVPCVTGSYIYVITHDTININEVYPFVSLTVPSTGSLLYVEGIYDRQPEQFTVILSDAPETVGYEINWLLPVAANITGGGGTTVHNDLTGLQGGTTNEYYHLTASEYFDYIGSTEVSNVSGNLQSQIDAISGAGGSDAVLIGGSGISVIESPADTWTISVSGNYATRTEVSNISGNLQSQIDSIVGESTSVTSSGGTIDISQNGYLFNVDVSDYISKTEVSNVSGNLQSQIDAISGGSDAVLIGGSGISVIESPADTWTISVSGNYATRTEVSNISGNLQSSIDTNTNDISNLQTDVNSISGNYVSSLNGLQGIVDINGLGAVTVSVDGQTINVSASANTLSGELISGTIPCITSQNVYSVSHDYVDTNTVFPFVSLTTPSSASFLYVVGIFNRTNTSFDVYLSNNPESDGYFINWLLTSGVVVSGGGSGSDAVLIGGSGISVNESPADTWTISVSGDYATNSYVDSISGSLQSDIDTNTSNIQNNANDIAVLQVDVSNLRTDVNSISANYATTTEVSNVSGNLQGQIDAIVEESTTITSSGGTIIVSQNGYLFNVDVSDYISKTEVENVSANLQSQIDAISGGGSGSDAVLIGGDGIQVVESPADTWTISVSGDYALDSDVVALSAAIDSNTSNINSLQTQVDGMTGNLYQGSEPCIVGQKLYTIAHGSVDTTQIYPHVSLVAPTSGSTLYIAGILNQQSTQFDVVLSGVPSVSGYYINWLMIDSIYGGGSGGGAASIESSQVNSLITLDRSENQYVGVLSGQISGDGGFLLPSNPIEMDKIEFKDEEYLAATYNVNISGNGYLIDEDSYFTMDQNGQSFFVRFAHGRWRIF